MAPKRTIATLLGPTPGLLSPPSQGASEPPPSFRPRPELRNASAIEAFTLLNGELTMPFSLTSYLLGAGTVVGGLAFGFGGGVLLTKTAMKDTSTAETRVERVKRVDSPSAPPRAREAEEAKAVPAPPAEPTPVAKSPPQVQAAPQDQTVLHVQTGTGS